MTLQISGIVWESIVDGPGIRAAVFTQGCPHHCPGCHNPQTWPFEGGETMTVEQIFEEFRKNPFLKGITFSGGEPFSQPGPLAELAEKVHALGKDVVVFTGYTYEQLLDLDDPAVNALLAQTDTLIDGPFIQELKSLELDFRGSENQRVIDMARTRETGKLVIRS